MQTPDINSPNREEKSEKNGTNEKNESIKNGENNGTNGVHNTACVNDLQKEVLNNSGKTEKVEKSENNSNHTIVSPKCSDENVIKINRELFIDCHEKLLSYTASIQRPAVELPLKNIENIKKIEQIENLENIVDIPAH